MRSSLRRRFERFQQVIESLEPRRLLTYVYNATAGNELIDIRDVAGGTQITGPAGPVVTSDRFIVVNLLAGNDTVDFFTLGSSVNVTVIGGLGDDVVRYTRGQFTQHILGNIQFDEIDQEGTDSLQLFDDSGAAQRDPLRFNHTELFYDHSLPNPPTVGYSFHVETKLISLNGGNDRVFADRTPRGMDLRLGGGNNNVTFFGATHDIIGSIFNGKVTGSGIAGTDTIVFDDAGGSFGFDYEMSDTSVLQQELVGIDDVTILTRSANANQPNRVEFDGIPAIRSLTIEGSSEYFETSFGASSAPIDLDARQITINHNVVGTIEIFNQDSDNVNFDWEVYTSNNRTRQHIAKGFFNLNFPDLLASGPTDLVLIEAGSSSDTFEISGQVLHRTLGIHAGGGSDLLVTANRNSHDNDLDDIFASGKFFFFGEAGYDVVDLADDADGIADGDGAYIVDEIGIFKGDFSNPSTNPLVQFDPDGVDGILFIAGADDNFFQLGGSFDTQMSVFGGGGNDVFYNRASSGLGAAMSIDATVVGGPGTDQLLLNDSPTTGTPNTDYQLDATAFSASRTGDQRGKFRYDSTLERIDLTQNTLATTTRIIAKPSATELRITDPSGNDTYIVGGGDLDASGLRLSNTNIIDSAGVDFITFDDTLDTNDDAAAELIVVQNGYITKDAAGVNFIGLEAQTFLMGSAGAGGTNQINVSSMATTIADTQIIGGATRLTSVNVANGLLSALGGTMTIDLNAGGGSVNVNNQNASANADYTITSSLIDGSYTINLSDVQLLQVNAGSGVDRFFINSVGAGREVDAFGNNGNDEFYAGNGSLASLAGTVLLVGGGGSDFMRFSNASAVGTTTATMTSSTFTFGTRTHSYSQMETAQITGSLLGSTFDVQSLSTGMNATVSGNNSADLVRFGNGDMDVTSSTLTFNGGNGSDRLEMLDANDTGDSDLYTLSTFGSTDRMSKTAGTITVIANSNDVEKRILTASAGSTVIQVNNTISALDINANGGDDHVRVDDSAGRVVVDTGIGLDSLTINSDSGTPLDTLGAATIAVTDDVRNLDIKPTGVLHVEGLLVKSFAAGSIFNVQGTIDFNGGSLISRAGGPGVSTFRNWIVTGRNGGQWNGTSAAGAINSSLAAGTTGAPPDAVVYAIGADIIPYRIDDITIAAGDVVVRYTYAGDADLNRVVDFDDYSRIDGGFNVGRTGWTNGDFDYNGIVDFDDYSLIDQAFNTQIPLAKHDARLRPPRLLADI
ncbi:MAG: hypothetical protein H7Z14_01410 [Anaerolineae bacterium]|nr:hypothetical protein [Phycisphaerae bacterium]